MARSPPDFDEAEADHGRTRRNVAIVRRAGVGARGPEPTAKARVHLFQLLQHDAGLRGVRARAHRRPRPAGSPAPCFLVRADRASDQGASRRHFAQRTFPRDRFKRAVL